MRVHVFGALNCLLSLLLDGQLQGKGKTGKHYNMKMVNTHANTSYVQQVKSRLRQDWKHFTKCPAHRM